MNEARAREGLGHLQAGVLELIAATRAFLDVVEDVVRDPATGTAVVSALSAVTRAVLDAADQGGDGHGEAAPDGGPATDDGPRQPEATTTGPRRRSRSHGVQRIQVS